jgi:acyl carrier protein
MVDAQLNKGNIERGKSRMTQRDGVEWIANLFEISPEQLTPDTLRDAISAWDSLGVLTLMASLDTDFGIVLTDDDVLTIKKVGDILDIMRKNGVLTESF